MNIHKALILINKYVNDGKINKKDLDRLEVKLALHCLMKNDTKDFRFYDGKLQYNYK